MEDLFLPAEERAYLTALLDVLRSAYGDNLVGVFLVGSASYGAYQPGISDLDVQAVVSDGISKESLVTLAGRLSHNSLPCPARVLEFVLYTKSTAKTASPRPAWSLNLNTGRDREEDLVQLEPDADGGGHWYLIDLACARELGRTLHGREDISQVFAAPDREWVLSSLRECVQWFAEHDPASPSAVLNACRAWRWTVDAVWGSKLQGAQWLLKKPRAVVQLAREMRLGESTGPIPEEQARAFLAMVVSQISSVMSDA
ncbi:streptomycin 3''-adenylyltransferase [Auricularia subglabra TFB-10046 SS5]|nr:streptomycin 3''-adenylyltransferase [Auricularia subglabra TFB-10046 SS5]